MTLKRKRIQIRLILKKDKNLIYNSQHSFTKDIDETDKNKVLKPKVLDNVGDLFNELYYIYKDKYNEEKDGLNTKNKKVFYYEKLRLTDDYQYESEEEKKEEKEQQTSKKEPLKKPTKDDVSNFNEWVNKKETGINYELF